MAEARSTDGRQPHPDQPRLTRDELRAMGRQIQEERLGSGREALSREAQGYAPHPAQPRLSGADVRAHIAALATQLDARREAMAREHVEAPERLRELDGGYSY
jgi:hypothetical protein